METIITEEKNGLNIVVGFGEPAIDPVATKAATDSVIKNTPEFKALSDLQSKIAGLSQMSMQAKKESTELRKQGKVKESDNKYTEFLIRQDQVKAEQEKIKAALPGFEKAKSAALMSDPVYFEPKKGEYLVSDAQSAAAKAKYSGLTEFQNLALNADFSVAVVPDYSGVKYWTNNGGWSLWPGHIVGEVLPDGALLDRDLTDAQRAEISEQFEKERVAKLSRAEKDAELARLTDSLAAQAVQMKAKLEIQGDPDALAKSQAWYQAEVDKINLKYK